MSIKTLILTGEGINCEVETAHAFDKAGGTSTIMHLHDFLLLPSLDEYDILAFPGGFSFGDEIRSGKIVAELIKLHQFEALKKFINNGKPVLGICNGFQILTQLGVFNDFEQGSFTLSQKAQATRKQLTLVKRSTKRTLHACAT
jgi:phosphoribosylformylglycinamidine synthase